MLRRPRNTRPRRRATRRKPLSRRRRPRRRREARHVRPRQPAQPAHALTLAAEAEVSARDGSRERPQPWRFSARSPRVARKPRVPRVLGAVDATRQSPTVSAPVAPGRAAGACATRRSTAPPGRAEKAHDDEQPATRHRSSAESKRSPRTSAPSRSRSPESGADARSGERPRAALSQHADEKSRPNRRVSARFDADARARRAQDSRSRAKRRRCRRAGPPASPEREKARPERRARPRDPGALSSDAAARLLDPKRN